MNITKDLPPEVEEYVMRIAFEMIMENSDVGATAVHMRMTESLPSASILWMGKDLTW